jgi:undecaprenyl-diphosphatase
MWLCVAAAIAFTLLAGWVAHRSATAFDAWTFDELYEQIPNSGASLLLGFSEPALPITLCGGVAVIGAIVRRWDFVTLAVVGPTVTVVLTKWVLKPLLGRTLGTDQFAPVLGPIPPADAFTVTGAFPSGHESAVASAACLLVIVTLQLQLSRRARTIAVAVIAIWTVVAALGLVRNFWHYATDTIGAMLLAVVIVFGLALLIDRFGTTVSSRVHAARREPARRS